jgi:hypothetical protein
MSSGRCIGHPSGRFMVSLSRLRMDWKGLDQGV